MEHIRVPRTARFAWLGRSEADELWVALHGYGQLAGRFLRRFRDLPGLEDGRRRVVAPEALNRFYLERNAGGHGQGTPVGATWMTREDREIEIRDYIAYLDAVLDHVRGGRLADGVRRPPATPGGKGADVVLGFSQGAETASRWAVLGARPPGTLILWGGGLAEDLSPAALGRGLRGARVIFVVGDEDEWGRKRSAAGIRVLREIGLEPERVGFGGGHRLDPAVLSSVAGSLKR